MDLRTTVLNIFVAVLIIIALMVILDLVGVNLSSPPAATKVLKQVVTLEGLDMNSADDFCSSKPSCEKLTDKNCNKTSCCVLLNGEKCVPGAEDGPTFKTNKGEKVNVDYYYFQNKCYGDADACNK
jgi:hypothetical protein